MVYSKSTLAQIGKEVISKHPDIASSILDTIKPAKPIKFNLGEIPGYFNDYCTLIQVDPKTLQGPVFKSSVNEDRKVFLSVMIALYGEPFKFNKAISDALEMFPPAITVMSKEVKFRYSKDIEFTEKVNKILVQIILSPVDKQPQ